MSISQPIALPTHHGTLWVRHFGVPEGECLIIKGMDVSGPPFVRLHSSCAFSESFGANNCDCGLQLETSLAHVAQIGGFVIYSWEEGRGLGIRLKMEAILLEQNRNINTRDAFAELGHAADPRNFETAIQALKAAGVGPKIRLATGNPKKEEALRAAGFDIVERVRLEFEKNEAVCDYLKQKQEALGHYGEN